MSEKNSRLVYSTDGGRVRDTQSKPAPAKPGKSRGPSGEALPGDPGDGIVRLHRGKSARGGKPGTLIVGLPGSDDELNGMLRSLKQKLGSGGARQGRILIIQGDHREKLQQLLEAQGHRVKLAGG